MSTYNNATATTKTASAQLAAENTLTIVARMKEGDSCAVDDLVRRCLPPLRRWAHGKLPGYARDLRETQDIVQECMIDTLKRVPHINVQQKGALHHYLRRAVSNRIRTEIQRARRRPERVEFDGERLQVDTNPSPLEALIGRERAMRYRAAVDGLELSDRELIIGRLEKGMSFKELAAATGRPSADAARMATARAAERLKVALSQV